MEITYELGNVFMGTGNAVHNAEVLRILLDCSVNLNLSFLRHHKVPPLYASGVVYLRDKTWKDIPALYKKKRGDCKSLAPALAAEYLNKGIAAKPVFRFKKVAANKILYHILVMVPNKNGYEKKLYEDPSVRLGMGLNDSWQVLDM